jgi:alanine racemase
LSAWPTKTESLIFGFDVGEAKAVKEELSDKVTIMIMGLVQDEDLEWSIMTSNSSFFETSRLTKAGKRQN